MATESIDLEIGVLSFFFGRKPSGMLKDRLFTLSNVTFWMFRIDRIHETPNHDMAEVLHISTA